MLEGMVPPRWLLLTVKRVRFGRAVKLKGSRVPSRLYPARSMSEMEFPLLQATQFQLQSREMLATDHEDSASGGGDGSEFFHFSRA